MINEKDEHGSWRIEDLGCDENLLIKSKCTVDSCERCKLFDDGDWESTVEYEECKIKKSKSIWIRWFGLKMCLICSM